MPLRVEPADTKELEQIRTWRYEGFYASFNYALENEGWLDTYRAEKIYRVEKDQRTVGIFFLIERKDGKWEYRILVHPVELGKGFGKRITLIALREAQRLGIDELMLLVRLDHDVAYQLYRSVGFVETGRVREIIAGKWRVMRRMVKRMSSSDESVF